MKVSIGGRRFGDRAILGPIAFETPPGAVTALVGRSGVGKTTLLRLIAGLDRAGAPCVSGAGRMAVVFQAPTLLPWRSALDNVRIPARVAAEVALAALAEVGLGDRGGAFPGQLSLGQQRRVALARAFAAAPDMLLLDEPFVSLDPGAAAQMRALTLGMLARRGAGALIVTHDLAEAAAMADRVLVLAGSPAAIALDRALVLPRPARDTSWIAAEAARLGAEVG